MVHSSGRALGFTAAARRLFGRFWGTKFLQEILGNPACLVQCKIAERFHPRETQLSSAQRQRSLRTKGKSSAPPSPLQAKFGRGPSHQKILTVVLAQHHPQRPPGILAERPLSENICS